MSTRRFLDRFPLITEVEAGQPVKSWVPICDQCDYPTKIRFSGKRLPPEALSQILRKRGWQTGNSFICPRCQEGKKPMAPAARRAAFCAINNVKRVNDPAPAPKLEEPVMAEAPRTATPEERRRIRDALDEHYIEEKACYKQSFSDKALAAKLSVPVKWVADLRELNGFGPDANEAEALRAAELVALEAKLQQTQTDLLARFDEIEAELKRIKVSASYKAA